MTNIVTGILFAAVLVMTVGAYLITGWDVYEACIAHHSLERCESVKP